MLYFNDPGASGQNPFGGAAGFDAEEILKSFFGGRDGPFGGFRTTGDFEDFQQAQQVNNSNYNFIWYGYY